MCVFVCVCVCVSVCVCVCVSVSVCSHMLAWMTAAMFQTKPDGGQEAEPLSDGASADHAERGVRVRGALR